MNTINCIIPIYFNPQSVLPNQPFWQLYTYISNKVTSNSKSQIIISPVLVLPERDSNLKFLQSFSLLASLLQNPPPVLREVFPSLFLYEQFVSPFAKFHSFRFLLCHPCIILSELVDSLCPSFLQQSDKQMAKEI